MQFNGKQPLGVVYNTSMSRPDAALALALLYGFTGKREARIGSVCVNGSGLGAAIFCDVVSAGFIRRARHEWQSDRCRRGWRRSALRLIRPIRRWSNAGTIRAHRNIRAA